MQSCNCVLQERSSRQRYLLQLILLTCSNVMDMLHNASYYKAYLAVIPEIIVVAYILMYL